MEIEIHDSQQAEQYDQLSTTEMPTVQQDCNSYYQQVRLSLSDTFRHNKSD